MAVIRDMHTTVSLPDCRCRAMPRGGGFAFLAENLSVSLMTPGNPNAASPPLNGVLRLLVGLLAVVALALLVTYWAMPAKSTTVTTMYSKSGQKSGSSRQVQEQRSDGVVLGLLGLGAVLGLTAISGGRLSFTGPGGVSLQVVAAIGAAGEAIGAASVSAAADDPAFKDAAARWQGQLDAFKRN